MPPAPCEGHVPSGELRTRAGILEAQRAKGLEDGRAKGHLQVNPQQENGCSADGALEKGRAFRPGGGHQLW